VEIFTIFASGMSSWPRRMASWISSSLLQSPVREFVHHRAADHEPTRCGLRRRNALDLDAALQDDRVGEHAMHLVPERGALQDRGDVAECCPRAVLVGRDQEDAHRFALLDELLVAAPDRLVHRDGRRDATRLAALRARDHRALRERVAWILLAICAVW